MENEYIRGQWFEKVYTTIFGGNKVEALEIATFSVEKGEYVAIMGESGSGKTTLLNILAALDKPTGGTVCLEGVDLSKIKESAIASFRREHLGFVFQDFNLLDTFTLEDNIYLPLVLAGKRYSQMKERPFADCRQTGYNRHIKKSILMRFRRTKQRAAVARALITSPKLIFGG